MMPVAKFLFATLVTALCLDSAITYVMVFRGNPDLFWWAAMLFGAKLVVAALAVAAAVWARSAWRAWHG